MENGKVQTNEHNVNVLVETTSSSSEHWCHLDFEVECEKMTDEEIIEAYKKLNLEVTIDFMKDVLKKTTGYAISNCSGDYFTFRDLFTYKKL